MREKSGLGPGQVFAMQKRTGRGIGRFGLEILTGRIQGGFDWEI